MNSMRPLFTFYLAVVIMLAVNAVKNPSTDNPVAPLPEPRIFLWPTIVYAVLGGVGSVWNMKVANVFGGGLAVAMLYKVVAANMAKGRSQTVVSGPTLAATGSVKVG